VGHTCITDDDFGFWNIYVSIMYIELCQSFSGSSGSNYSSITTQNGDYSIEFLSLLNSKIIYQVLATVKESEVLANFT
jgi:hypothetical protein